MNADITGLKSYELKEDFSINIIIFAIFVLLIKQLSAPPLGLRIVTYVMARRISCWGEDMPQNDQIQKASLWGTAIQRGNWKLKQFPCFIFVWRRSNP